MTIWFIIAGAVALVMAYAAGQVRRMPLSTAVVYLVTGYLLGPNVFGVLKIDPRTHAAAIEAITETVIVVSIFSSALKLRMPIFDRRWLDPLRLALGAMAGAAALGALVGHFALGWSWGAALLLAAVLSPTDPVLASDVQVERPYHFSRLRFTLTGEAGMNDGAALPLVILGLALIGAGPSWSTGWIWVLKNIFWGFLGAAAIGGLLGHFGGKFMLHLRLVHQQKLGTDNFLALGVMGLSYGLATAAHTIGFVGVFAAGVAVRRIEQRMHEEPPETIEVRVSDTAAEQEVATDPDRAAAFMLLRLLSFTENLERIGEAIVVVLVGSLLRNSMWIGATLIFAPLLFFVIRPASVLLALIGSHLNWTERSMAAWFGIRGMASVYYLPYILSRRAPDPILRQIAEITIGVIAYSILLHGVSVTPLMRWFERRRQECPEDAD